MAVPEDKRQRQEFLDALAAEIDDALGCVEIEDRAKDGVPAGYRDELLPFDAAQTRLQAIIAKLDELDESDDLHVRKVLGLWRLRIRSLRYYASLRTQMGTGFRSEFEAWPRECAACRAEPSRADTIDVAGILRAELAALELLELTKRAKADPEQLAAAKVAGDPKGALIALVLEKELGSWHLRTAEDGGRFVPVAILPGE